MGLPKKNKNYLLNLCNKKNFFKKANDLAGTFRTLEILTDLFVSYRKNCKQKLKKKRCKVCFTVFFSTWFNDLIKKKIFLSIYGQHNMGWQNFYDFKKNLLSPNHGDLFKDLKNMIKFKTYGEYGCPFNGLMFDLLKEEVKQNYLKKYINLNIKHLSEKVRDFILRK